MGSLISGFPSTRLRHLPFFESEGPTTITLIIIAPPNFLLFIPPMVHTHV